MDRGAWIYGVEVAILAVMLATSELAFRAGRRAHPRRRPAVVSEVGFARVTIFAIFGLLVAFTVSMAEEHFSDRRRLILHEANAIETALLRSKYLAEPHPAELAPLIERYVDARVAFLRVGGDPSAIERETERSERLQREIWAHAIEVVRDAPSHEATNAAFIQSVNEMIDLEAARVAALHAHVPVTVIILLVFVGLLACATNGYACGLGGMRAWSSVALMPLLVAIAIVVVIDLDSPRLGFATTGQVPLERLQQSLVEPPP